MREQLLNGSEGLYLQKTRSRKPCSMSGEQIPKGEHAISVRQDRGASSYLVWVSLSSVDELAARLERFDPDDHDADEEPVLASGTEHVKYQRTHGQKQFCAVCEEQVEPGSAGISFYLPASTPDMVWIHPGCRHRLAEGLDRVWEYADELLPEQV